MSRRPLGLRRPERDGNRTHGVIVAPATSPGPSRGALASVYYAPRASRPTASTAPRTPRRLRLSVHPASLPPLFLRSVAARLLQACSISLRLPTPDSSSTRSRDAGGAPDISSRRCGAPKLGSAKVTVNQVDRMSMCPVYYSSIYGWVRGEGRQGLVPPCRLSHPRIPLRGRQPRNLPRPRNAFGVISCHKMSDRGSSFRRRPRMPATRHDRDMCHIRIFACTDLSTSVDRAVYEQFPQATDAQQTTNVTSPNGSPWLLAHRCRNRTINDPTRRK